MDKCMLQRRNCIFHIKVVETGYIISILQDMFPGKLFFFLILCTQDIVAIYAIGVIKLNILIVFSTSKLLNHR